VGDELEIAARRESTTALSFLGTPASSSPPLDLPGSDDDQRRAAGGGLPLPLLKNAASLSGQSIPSGSALQRAWSTTRRRVSRLNCSSASIRR
jgi:hypothetical protein